MHKSKTSNINMRILWKIKRKFFKPTKQKQPVPIVKAPHSRNRPGALFRRSAHAFAMHRSISASCIPRKDSRSRNRPSPQSITTGTKISGERARPSQKRVPRASAKAGPDVGSGACGHPCLPRKPPYSVVLLALVLRGW